MIRTFGVVGLGIGLIGCYTQQPIGSTVPVPGTLVTFDLTDAGRSALGGSMGPEIVQIDGRVIENDTTGYIVGVSGVRYIGGGTQAWRGEQVRIKPDYVRTTFERRFSKTRTAVLAAAGVGAVAYLVTRSLLGSGSVMEVPVGCDTCSTVASVRIPRP
jgi:hypothetical protein